MSDYIYSVKQGSSINCWQRSMLQKEKVESKASCIDAPVNMTEGYQEVEYPIRANFLQTLSEVPYPGKQDFSEIYDGFENPRVDFSTFQATPHKVSTYLRAQLRCQEKQAVECSLVTCGRAILWMNGKLLTDFRPYTRNHGTKTTVVLPLEQGDNELIVYMDDLAERDVNFFVELNVLSNHHFQVVLPLSYDETVLQRAEEFLNGLYFEKDFYSKGEVRICSDYDYFEKVFVTYEEVTFTEEIGGNITDFRRESQFLPLNNQRISLGNVEDIPTSGLTHLFVGVLLPDQTYLFKKLVFTVYNEEKLKRNLGGTLEVRKATALTIFSNLAIPDMNSALAEIHLTGKLSEECWKKLQPAFRMIKERGDCADFMFAPLLGFWLGKKGQLPEKLRVKLRELAIHFRYWIDEPGNDVMWYFSENHSLLFHACQYFAGCLLPEETFVTSGRQGSQQYELGKQRLLQWFDQFEHYGFSEWNSTTYLPIDLIVFFSLYTNAPDEEIKDAAKKALDFTFTIMAVNSHGGTLSSTFGRTYEHDLKAMRLGEISNILAIAWDRGNFNYALRASTLFCLSDYVPPKECMSLIDLQPNEELTATYLQGINRVQTYLYKCREYSIASGIEYHCFQKGHQQHMMNLSLGSDGTQLWINNPGEFMHSGENRPSYWAGNGRMPCIKQFKNILHMKYDLSKAYVPFIHMYVPYWNLERVDINDSNWLFIKKDQSYLGVYFSQGYEMQQIGDTRGRDIVSKGINHTVLVKCGSRNEFSTFETFMKSVKKSKMTDDSFYDPQFGALVWQEIEHLASYQVIPVLKTKEGAEHEET